MEAKDFSYAFPLKGKGNEQLTLILSIPDISLQTIIVQRFMHLSIHLQQNVLSFFKLIFI